MVMGISSRPLHQVKEEKHLLPPGGASYRSSATPAV